MSSKRLTELVGACFFLELGDSGFGYSDAVTRTGISVLTITHNRDQHLMNLLSGLAVQTEPPDEIILVFMNQADHLSLPETLPIKTVYLPCTESLPLARARNAAAAASRGQTLVFLDVDCIPANTFVEKLTAATGSSALAMGTPKYLPPSWDGDQTSLEESSKTHPARAGLKVGLQTNYSAFWSLCFAMQANDFDQANGFDENFIGYGAEDTDFAWRCKNLGIPFQLSDATAYHQHHATHRPPLDHFDDIVRNARTFRNKWDTWPMEGWLTDFAAMNLIEWDRSGTTLQVLRRPSIDEQAAALSTDTFA